MMPVLRGIGCATWRIKSGYWTKRTLSRAAKSAG